MAFAVASWLLNGPKSLILAARNGQPNSEFKVPTQLQRKIHRCFMLFVASTEYVLCIEYVY